MEHRLRTPEGAAASPKRSQTSNRSSPTANTTARCADSVAAASAPPSEWAFIRLAANPLKLRQRRAAAGRLTRPPDGAADAPDTARPTPASNAHATNDPTNQALTPTSHTFCDSLRSETNRHHPLAVLVGRADEHLVDRHARGRATT